MKHNRVEARLGADDSRALKERGGAQWANLGLHEDILNQYCYFMYFQPNFHVRTLYKHCVCVFLVFLCLRLRIFVKCALKTEFSQD